MKVKLKVEKRKPKEVVTALVCPHCRGTNLVWSGGYITGQKYHCTDCHYRGTFVLERKVVVEDDESVKEL